MSYVCQCLNIGIKQVIIRCRVYSYITTIYHIIEPFNWRAYALVDSISDDNLLATLGIGLPVFFLLLRLFLAPDRGHHIVGADMVWGGRTPRYLVNAQGVTGYGIGYRIARNLIQSHEGKT